MSVSSLRQGRYRHFTCALAGNFFGGNLCVPKVCACACHSLCRFGNTDAVVPKALSLQVFHAWSAAAAAAAGGEVGADSEALTQFFEHDGGHFLPASKQVTAAHAAVSIFEHS
jgi:hypothetical protein